MPPHDCKALMMLCFSISSSFNGNSGASGISTGCACTIFKSAKSISVSLAINTARLILFCNSLILPDQECESNNRSASAVKPVLSRCSSAENFSRKKLASGKISSGHSASEGCRISNSPRRWYKSSRKRPSAIAFPISSLVAATIRTSATRSTLEPTGINVPSCNTRSNEDCISYGNVPISSRKSVPPLAASKQPPLSASAPVNAPFACPKNVEATSS